ncbi:hypothetical protein A2U01_0092568, partial [Trifolium medium]|nr:hypothetical protein [Trifolium medium]
TRWKSSGVGWVKLNTDRACKDGRIAGCGGIIRGEGGN